MKNILKLSYETWQKIYFVAYLRHLQVGLKSQRGLHLRSFLFGFPLSIWLSCHPLCLPIFQSAGAVELMLRQIAGSFSLTVESQK